MKKVMLYAYTGINLGDDLFIKILCERYPETKFILFAPRRYKSITNDLNNLKIIPSDSIIVRGLNFLIRLFKRHYSFRNFIGKFCDMGVQIGGSIFMQGEDWENNTKRKGMMLNDNQPFFVLGANFGPYTDDNFYFQNRKLIERYTDICFRDQYSYNLFQDLENVRLADDIVFQLENNSSKEQLKNIVISVIKPSYRKNLKGLDDVYFNKIKEIAIHFVKKDFDVTLMSFCKKEGDEEAITSILNNIPKEYKSKVSKYHYQLDMNEALEVISSSSFVVATRFHSMILGWIYNKPVYPIAYSEKMTNVMHDLNFKGSYSTFNNLHELQMDEVDTSLLQKPLDISKQAKNAEQHFKELDKLLLDTVTVESV